MLQIGEHPNLGDLIQAPLGTTLGDSYDRTFTKHLDGWHFEQAVHGPDMLLQGWSVTVASIGTEPVPVETFQQYAQRLGTIGRGRAHQSGVNLHPVRRLLAALEADSTGTRLGMWHHPYDRDTAIPQGAIGRMGDTHYVRTGTEWRLINGTARAANGPIQRCVQVVHLPPGVVPLAWDEASDMEVEAKRIDEVRREAWRLGLEAKSSNNWCSDFENAMDRCHISQRALALLDSTASDLQFECPIPLGKEGEGQVTHEIMLAAPIGTIIGQGIGPDYRWRKDEEDYWSRISERGIQGPSLAFQVNVLYVIQWGAS